jgi:hypothetical protein
MLAGRSDSTLYARTSNHLQAGRLLSGVACFLSPALNGASADGGQLRVLGDLAFTGLTTDFDARQRRAG